MKQKIVPTSPKSPWRSQTTTPDSHLLRWMKKPQRILFIIFTLAAASLAGFWSVIIAATIPSDWPILGRFNILALVEQEQQGLVLPVETNGNPSPITRSAQVFDHLAALYDVVPTMAGSGTFLGNAVMLTSDGWMVAGTSLFRIQNDRGHEQERQPVVLDRNGRQLPLIRTIEDDDTGLTFFQVEGENFNAIPFPDRQLLSLGQSFFVLEQRLGTLFASERSIAGARERGHAQRSTDDFQEFFLLDHLQSLSQSAPLVAHSGNFVGMTLAEGAVVPANVIQGTLRDILTHGVPTPPRYVFAYSNLARVTVEERRVRNLPDVGIVILAARAAQDSTAQEQQPLPLQPNDVILALNHLPVDAHTDLGTFLHATRGDSPIVVSIVRSGEQQTIEFAF